MTYNFYLAKRKTANGMQNIQISISNGRNYRKWVITDLNVFASKFNAKKGLFKAKKSHPAYISVNKALRRYKDRCEEAYSRWQSGDYSMNQVVGHIKGHLNDESIEDFIKSYILPNKSNQNGLDIQSKWNIIKGHMNMKGNTKWKDINRDFYDKLANNWRKSDLANKSIKSYCTALAGILSDAKERNIISHYTPIPKQLRKGGKKKRLFKKQLKTTTSKEFEKNCDNIENITQWESFAFWLLAFCLRGFYPADIVKMQEAELDEPTIAKMLKNELYIYHLRSKSEHTENTHMYIHLDIDITMPLILVLKRVIAYRWMKKYSKQIASSSDLINIFDYNPTDNKKWHSNRWALQTRRLRPYGMNMMNPRKSFETFAEEIEISDKNTPVEFNELMRLILLGRAHDPILSKSYSNVYSKRMRESVTEAHRYILKEYRCRYLVGVLIKKLQALNVPNWVKAQPFYLIENIYEDMNKEGRGKLLEASLKLYGDGKILDKGWFVGSFKNKKVSFEKIDKAYARYWQDSISGVKHKWEQGEDYEEVVKSLAESPIKTTKGKVIKMPFQRRQNQEKEYRFSVN